ncbi:hypothetical protein DFQ11_10127 [Winogradskyella epiphytica]|uniref:Uncharacterized protein n=1 Tax=Winogradskyella epiphytica TaxID=262005 RepID=A0A2V4WY58_9FLAO|nr:hypothetical protein [Winogradskyella epiphytica]PYE82602.1 hypothetical protein DFQ11_10127 [Winogradskyella epiphytica]
MNFTFTHKAISFALSILVLFSTLSLTVTKHFCGDVLIDVAIFSEGENCGTKISGIESDAMLQKSCCKDEIHVIDGLSETTISSFDDLDVIQQHVLIAYSLSYVKLFKDLSEYVVPHQYYSPPKLIRDIQLLDETFLI